jgi:hypothetical protein
MLKQVSPDLPSEDHRRLVKVSQGFPQIAFLLGQSWLKESSIAAATDAELFDRIILGRNQAMNRCCAMSACCSARLDCSV